MCSIVRVFGMGYDIDIDVAGALDFFVNSVLLWGFELLRDGDRVGGYLDRFKGSGKYTHLALRDYRVIDFKPVPATGPRRVTKEKLVRVYMRADDFRAVAICSRQRGVIHLDNQG